MCHHIHAQHMAAISCCSCPGRLPGCGSTGAGPHRPSPMFSPSSFQDFSPGGGEVKKKQQRRGVSGAGLFNFRSFLFSSKFYIHKLGVFHYFPDSSSSDHPAATVANCSFLTCSWSMSHCWRIRQGTCCFNQWDNRCMVISQ